VTAQVSWAAGPSPARTSDHGHPTVSASDAVRSPWRLAGPDLADRLGTDVERGLTSAEAAGRLADVGPNRLDAATRVPWWRKLLAQFADALVYVLVGAIAISLAAWVLGFFAFLRRRSPDPSGTRYHHGGEEDHDPVTVRTSPTRSCDPMDLRHDTAAPTPPPPPSSPSTAPRSASHRAAHVPGVMRPSSMPLPAPDRRAGPDLRCPSAERADLRLDAGGATGR
jgi:hypothetical protein